MKFQSPAFPRPVSLSYFIQHEVKAPLIALSSKKAWLFCFLLHLSPCNWRICYRHLSSELTLITLQNYEAVVTINYPVELVTGTLVDLKHASLVVSGQKREKSEMKRSGWTGDGETAAYDGEWQNTTSNSFMCQTSPQVCQPWLRVNFHFRVLTTLYNEKCHTWTIKLTKVSRNVNLASQDNQKTQQFHLSLVIVEYFTPLRTSLHPSSLQDN